MIRRLLQARNFTLALVLILLVLLLIFGRKVSYEQSIKSFFADDDPLMTTYQKAAASFGDDNFVFVAYEDPALFTADGMARVAELASSLGHDRIDGVARIESLDAMPLLWAIDDVLLTLDKLPKFARQRAIDLAKSRIKNVDLRTNALTVGGSIRSSAATPESIAAIKERVIRHPLFQGTVVDAKGLTTAIVVRLKKTGDHDVMQTIGAIRNAADAFATSHKLGKPAVVGPPVLLADGFTSIEVDGRRLAVVGMVLIGIVTLSAVQSLWWALVPILSGWVVWLATETILSVFNIKLSMSGGPLVAQIIVLTMPAASHLAIHFRDDRRREADPNAAAEHTLRAVYSPILWCAITGAIGYGALFLSDVVPIKQFGAILASCTMTAALLVMAISPVAMMPPFPLEIAVRHGSRSRVSSSMNKLTTWVVRNPLPIVGVVVLLVLPITFGMTGLRFESNYINAFKPETRVVKDYDWVEDRLGGIGLVEVVVPLSSPVDEAKLTELKSVEARINDLQLDGKKAVTSVISLATVLDPDGRIGQLAPAASSAVLATKLDLIALTPQAELLNGFWNAKTGEARILVRLLEQQPAPDKLAIFNHALGSARKAFGAKSYLTGLSFLMTKTTEAVIVTQWETFAWSAVGILAMLTMALRSPILAALAMLPTLLAVGLVLGLMGWMGVKLDMATALVASVALGLSVDDTFHCLLQYRRQRQSLPFVESLLRSYSVTGPGVLLSSLAVAIGFAALRFSEFAPFSNFGTMVGIATAGSTLGNLLLLPACLTLGQAIRNRWKARWASTSMSNAADSTPSS